jgi:hypothetical protein
LLTTRVRDSTWKHFQTLSAKAKSQIPLKEDQLVDFLTIMALSLQPEQREQAQILFMLALEVSARSLVVNRAQLIHTSWRRLLMADQ